MAKIAVQMAATICRFHLLLPLGRWSDLELCRLRQALDAAFAPRCIDQLVGSSWVRARLSLSRLEPRYLSVFYLFFCFQRRLTETHR